MTTSASIEHETSIFLECVRDSSLTQHVTRPTRFRHNQCDSTLDLIFTSEEGIVENLIILPGFGASDHAVICFNLLCYLPEMDRGSQKPNFFKYDYVAMSDIWQTMLGFRYL